MVDERKQPSNMCNTVYDQRKDGDTVREVGHSADQRKDGT